MRNGWAIFAGMLFVVLLFLLQHLICNDQKIMNDNSIVKLDSLKSKENGLIVKTEKRDQDIVDSQSVVIDQIKPHREKAEKLIHGVKTRLKTDSVHSVDSVVNELLQVVEEQQSIINLDSLNLALEHERYLNQKSLSDSLIVITNDLQLIARKESKRAAQAIKMVHRRDKIIPIMGGALVVTVTALVAPPVVVAIVAGVTTVAVITKLRKQ